MNTFDKTQSKIDSAQLSGPSARNSTFEILRIIAMLFIVLSHACNHSNFNAATQPLSLNRFFLQWGGLGSLGVNIYVLISGYFLSNKELTTRSISRLFAQVWFYSIALFLVCWLGFGYHYSLKQLIVVFLPTIFEEYWFFTAYFVLLLLSPFLNHFVRTASRKQLQRSLATMLTLWSVIRTITSKNMYGTELPLMTMLYLIGAYSRKYPDNWFQNKLHRVFLTLISFFLLFLSTVILGVLESKFSIFYGRAGFFYAKSSLLVVGCAIGLFGIFQNIKPSYNKIINTISGCTFGVYLIHDNPVVRSILWKQLLDNTPYFNTPSLIPRVLLSVIVVFLVCTMIEFVRKMTIEKITTEAIDSILNKLIAVVGKYANIFFK